MKLGELYQTVVLRDILGYMLPGGISLFALGTIAKRFGFESVQSVFPDLQFSYPWVNLIALLSLVYLAGHVVDECSRFLTALMVSGGLATARTTLCNCISEDLDPDLHQPLLEVLRTVLDKSDLNALQQGNANCLSDERLKTIQRLCDQYVLARSPELYHSVIGRAEVLHTFMANCGTSFIILGVALLLQLQFAPALRLQTISPSTVPLHVILISAGLAFVVARLFFRRSYAAWKNRNEVCFLTLYTPKPGQLENQRTAH